jgi:hypothetical protein
LEYAAKILAKNKNLNKNNIKSLSKDKNKSHKKTDNKEHSSSFKKNRTININININNTKNNIAMTDRPFWPNNNSNNNIINNNFPLSIKNNIKEKRFIFNKKKINSTLPYQLFRSSNIISNLNKKNKNINTNNNSINGLQQKLLEIFNRKLKKNKNNNRNNSYNLSLTKTSYTNRLRTKNKAFIISTIQNTILQSKSKRNHSINIKSDKNIYIKNKKEKKSAGTSKNNNKKENNNYSCNQRQNSHAINMNNINNIINNIDVEQFSLTKKNLKRYYTNNYKPILTISPSLKKRNIFGFKTMSKLTETNHDYKTKKIYNRNSDYNIIYNNNSHDKSLKNKTNIQKKISKINNIIFPYKTKNNK